jgi:predicted Ser/Thr protein kinase
LELKPEFNEKLNQIIRTLNSANDAEIMNPTNIRYVGKGNQGTVFQIDAERCVKFFGEKRECEQELHNLQLGNSVGICPKVFLWGEDYIVMEYFSSPSLLKYLKKNPLTKQLAAQLIDLLDSFECIGFNRLDHCLRHIYLLPNGQMKVIDVGYSIAKQAHLPKAIMRDLGPKALEFLQFVRETRPEWFHRWTNHRDFSELVKKAKKNAKRN